MEVETQTSVCSRTATLLWVALVAFYVIVATAALALVHVQCNEMLFLAFTVAVVGLLVAIYPLLRILSHRRAAQIDWNGRKLTWTPSESSPPPSPVKDLHIAYAYV